MYSLKFKVETHAPFFISSGVGAGTLDAVARKDSPLPASSLKGVMRAAATQVLQMPSETVEAIFGKEGSAGAWSWTDAGPTEDEPTEAFTVGKRSRIRLSDAGTAQRESLAATEMYWANTKARPSFFVEQAMPIEQGLINGHLAVLIASARAATAVGAWRNRGMGAVTLRCVDVHGSTELCQRGDRDGDPVKLDAGKVATELVKLRAQSAAGSGEAASGGSHPE